MSVEEAAPEEAPVVAAHPELSDYELQRVAWFEELGFTDLQALVLATTRDGGTGQHVTVHEIRVAIAGGCSLERAFEIFA